MMKNTKPQKPVNDVQNDSRSARLRVHLREAVDKWLEVHRDKTYTDLVNEALAEKLGLPPVVDWEKLLTDPRFRDKLTAIVKESSKEKPE